MNYPHTPHPTIADIAEDSMTEASSTTSETKRTKRERKDQKWRAGYSGWVASLVTTWMGAAVATSSQLPVSEGHHVSIYSKTFNRQEEMTVDERRRQTVFGNNLCQSFCSEEEPTERLSLDLSKDPHMQFMLPAVVYGENAHRVHFPNKEIAISEEHEKHGVKEWRPKRQKVYKHWKDPMKRYSKDENHWRTTTAQKDAWKLHKEISDNPVSVESFFNKNHYKKVAEEKRDLRRVRQMILDSGASLHMIDFKDLTAKEKKTVKSRNPMQIMTANGIITLDREVDLVIPELGNVTITAIIGTKDSPCLISMGPCVKKKVSIFVGPKREEHSCLTPTEIYAICRWS